MSPGFLFLESRWSTATVDATLRRGGFSALTLDVSFAAALSFFRDAYLLIAPPLSLVYVIR